MSYLISYDISDNKKRKQIIDILFEKGFRRIQKSVFLGDVKIKDYQNLTNFFSSILNTQTDKLFFISITENEYSSSFIIGDSPINIYKNDVLFI